MLVTKEPINSKAQMPTSPYLSSGSLQQATCVSLRLSENFLRPPTGPHVSRMWKIKLDDINNSNVYYTTPDTVFHGTGLRRYFVSLLSYQTAMGIIEPKDISNYKYRKLFASFKSLISTAINPISGKQKSAFIEVLQNLSRSINVSIADIHLQMNADGELVVFKKAEDGSHYIVVGDDSNDISYLYISNTPGVYTSIHKDEKNSVKDIIDSFSSE